MSLSCSPIRTVTPARGGREGGLDNALMLDDHVLSPSVSHHRGRERGRRGGREGRHGYVDARSPLSLSLTFKRVIGNLTMQENRIKIIHPQPFFLAGDRHARGAVCVNHAVGVLGPSTMDGRMNDEACPINRVWTGVDFPSCQVYLHQVQRRDFPIVKPKGIDQKVRVRARDTQSDMVNDLLIPATCIKDAVHACQFYSRCPLRQGHASGESCLQVLVEEELGGQGGGEGGAEEGFRRGGGGGLGRGGGGSRGGGGRSEDGRRVGRRGGRHGWV